MMTDSFDDDAVVVTSVASHIALVRLNRPHARNAVNKAVVDGMTRAVHATETDDDVWVTILTGTGDAAFCAGADLKEIAAGRIEAVRSERDGFGGFVFAQRRKPWIAAVNGPALAGGLELVLACEMIVSSDHAVFGLPEVKRSLVAGAGGTWRLPRSLPRVLAYRMILTGAPISASEALRHGLVNTVVPRAQVLDAALALASDVCAAAPLAVREAMAIARASVLHGETELRALSAAAMNRIRQTKDFAEGPRAFVEKRAPEWQGR